MGKGVCETKRIVEIGLRYLKKTGDEGGKILFKVLRAVKTPPESTHELLFVNVVVSLLQFLKKVRYVCVVSKIKLRYGVFDYSGTRSLVGL